MKTNDLAGKALSDSKIKSFQWMLLSRIRRGDTLKLEGFNQRLMALLKERAAELEAAPSLAPKSVTDWMALALFAKNRNRFAAACGHAEQAHDKAYHQAAFWLKRLIDSQKNRHDEDK